MLALVGWNGQLKCSLMELASNLRSTIKALKQPIRKPINGVLRGDERNCWQHVEKTVNKNGGKLLTGWSVLHVDPKLPQTNANKNIVLNAHAIWQRPDSEWEETILERHIQVGFIPSAVPTLNATVEFYDDQQSIEKAEPPKFSFDWKPFHYRVFEVKILMKG